MKRATLIITILFAFAFYLLALQNPASTPQATPSPSHRATAVDETPLTALPYEPSLDVKSMDKTADACTDFYQYSCGGWMKANPIPADESSWSVYGKLYNDNQRYLWGILNELARARTAPSAAKTLNANQQKLGDYFGSCMNEAAIEKAGEAPLKPALDEIAALHDKRQLAPLLAQLHLAMQGAGGMLFGFGSNQDFGDSSQVIAFAFDGGLSLPDRDYYTKNDEKSQTLRRQYAEHVSRMMQLLGDSAATANTEAQRILQIETDLAKASLTRVEKRDPYKLFHKMTRAQLQALTPDFDWNAYLAGSGLGSVDSFNVTEPDFYKEVNSELQSVSLDDWKTYLRWHYVHAKTRSLSSSFVNEDFAFYGKTLRGTPELPPRWKRCVGQVDRFLGDALGQEFVQRNFSADMKQRTQHMTQLIEAAMQQDLEHLAWMSEATREQALTKLHAVVNKIGYPDRWRDYSSMRIVPEDYFANVDQATMFESRRQLAKIGKPLDRGEWGMTAPTVNAGYEPQMNDITFPAGVLQPPLYDVKMDDAPNYGNTGSTIGHELTHGFDDEGRQFDAKGNLRDWWTGKDADEFKRRASCVVDQYAQYVVVDDIKINSKLTEGEDVADLGGTILAWAAWKAATVGQKLTNRDGLTPDQRFFIGLAQWACENNRPEEQRVNAITDPHSPGKYRINGLVVNLPQFGEAFHCKAGSPMVKPADKVCKVW